MTAHQSEDFVMVEKSVVGGLTANVKRWRGRASAERLKRQRWRKRALAAEAEVERLREAVTTALANLDDEHQPQWSSDEAAAKGKAPIGCTRCWPGDGRWPCSSRLIADDLRAALSGRTEAGEGQP